MPGDVMALYHFQKIKLRKARKGRFREMRILGDKALWANVEIA